MPQAIDGVAAIAADDAQVLSEILAAFPEITAKNRIDAEIAKKLSEGRTKAASVIGGLAKICEILGVDQGVACLSALDKAAADSPDYWLLQILRDARSDLGSPGCQLLIAASQVFSQEQRVAIEQVCIVSDPMSQQQVARALEGYFDSRSS